MNQAIIIAMLACIADLQRSIDMNEAFADHVITLANESYADAADRCEYEKMLTLARRHRVDAIKSRAKMDVMTDKFVRRFGIERLEQERSSSATRRRPI